MKNSKEKKEKSFNTLNHSIPLTEAEIISLRNERKETIRIYNSMRSAKKMKRCITRDLMILRKNTVRV